MSRSILVTGAAGALGRTVCKALAEQAPPGTRITATDVRPPPEVAGVDSRVLDIRDAGFVDVLREVAADVVVHLAAIVTPPPGATRAFLRSVDVDGTENVLSACVAAGVSRFVYTSSGAAYGYHPDSPRLLVEEDAIRGNEAFAYSWHKRLVEDLLARTRAVSPQLNQLVFRVSTILGPTVNNQITAMFERPIVVGVRGADTPFCFVSAADVSACIVAGAVGDQTGTFNLTGDGVMTLREIARGMGRRYVALPPGLLERGLAALHARGLSPYGPEQTVFLRYRPVMSNLRLKRDFGYTPTQTTRQVFESYRRDRV